MSNDNDDTRSATAEVLSLLAANLLPIKDAMELTGDAVKSMLPISRFVATVLDRLPPGPGEDEAAVRPVIEAAAALYRAWAKFEAELAKSGKPNPFAN